MEKSYFYSYITFRLIVFCIFLLSAPPLIANDCICPEVQCNSECEDQVDVNFYTEKCDQGRRLKSCRRPNCVLKDPLPLTCKGNQEAALEDQTKAEAGTKVIATSIAESGQPQPVVGTVVYCPNTAWVQRPGLEYRQRLRVGSKIQLLDVVQTSSGARLKIMFNDSNLVSLAPESQLAITEFVFNPGLNQKKTVLDLMKGQVRNEVKQKYDGQRNTYRVRTLSAVAGVRGTDFITSLDNNMATHVITLHGLVELGARANPETIKQVPAGTRLSVVTDGTTAQINEGNDELSVIAQGQLGQPIAVSEVEAAALKQNWIYEQGGTEAESVRNLASASESKEADSLCNDPQGNYNQCSWSCEKGGKPLGGMAGGTKACPTEDPKIQCMRRRCTASGKWLDPYQLPASLGKFCMPGPPRVGPCDY